MGCALHIRCALSIEKYGNQISTFMKIRPVGTVVPCGHTDRRTNLTKHIVAFYNFENALKKDKITVFIDAPNFTLRK
jgi:hypothetical protein